MWKLTPVSRWNWKNNKAIIDSYARKSIQQLSNYSASKSKLDIMKNLLKTKSAREIFEESKRWVDFDYVVGLEFLICSTDPLADEVMKLVINDWVGMSFPTVLAKIGGIDKFKEVIALLYKKEPEIFNFLKEKWPEVENYLE